MQEAHEERGVEAHRAGGVEQEHEPQRFLLALPPGEIERRAAVSDAAVNGAAQIEPPSAPTHALTADQARAHDARQPRGQLMRLFDILGLDDVAQIGGGEVVEARGAFAFAAAVAGDIALLVAALEVIGQARLAAGRADVLERAHGRAACERRAGKRARLTQPMAVPEGVEDLVEALPIGMRGAKQRAQRRLQRGGTRGDRRGEDGQRIAGLGEADLEAVIAQRARETGKPPAGGPTETTAF